MVLSRLLSALLRYFPTAFRADSGFNSPVNFPFLSKFSPTPITSPFPLPFFLFRPRKRAKKKGAARRGAGFSVNYLSGVKGSRLPCYLNRPTELCCWTDLHGKTPNHTTERAKRLHTGRPTSRLPGSPAVCLSLYVFASSRRLSSSYRCQSVYKGISLPEGYQSRARRSFQQCTSLCYPGCQGCGSCASCEGVRAMHMAGPAPSGDFWFLLVASKGTRRRQGIWGNGVFDLGFRLLLFSFD